MRKKPVSRRKAIQSTMSLHSHQEGHCLDILRRLSAYIDDELPSEICRELRRHLGSCPNCEVFVASLRDTVMLCRHRPTPQLSASDRSALRREIIEACKSGVRM